MRGTDELAGDVFVSYVREDSHYVDLLQLRLQAVGVRVWRDTADLWPGEDWKVKIRRTISEDALVFIACFSRRSLARDRSYQNEELALATEQLRLRSPDHPWLIPVRFDDCDIPDRDIGGGRTLASIQCADLFGDRYDEAFSRLVATVLQILRRQNTKSVETDNHGKYRNTFANDSTAQQAARAHLKSPPSPPFAKSAPIPSRLTRTLTGHSGSVIGITFSADGHMLTTVAEDSTARQWDLANGVNVRTIQARAKVVQTAAFSPDGSAVATASDDCAIDLWNCKTGEHYAHFQYTHPVRAVAFSPDGQLLAAGSEDGRVRLRHLATGQDLIILKDQNVAVRAVAFSSDGRVIAISGGQDGRVWLCDPTNGRQLRLLKRPMGFLEGLQGNVNVMTFSPDGRLLVTGGQDKKARLWSPATGRHLRDLRRDTGFFLGRVYAVAFRPDGRLLATGGGHIVWLWNPATGENLGTLVTEESTDVITVAFNPDGHLLVTTNRNSGAIRLWS